MSRITKVIVALFAGLMLSTGTAVADVPRHIPRPKPPRPQPVWPYPVWPQYRTDRGAWISYVQPGGPAARAGLEPGDMILSVNGQRITSREHLQDALARSRGRAVMEVINGRDNSRVYVTAFPTGNDLGIQFTIRDFSPDPWQPMPWYPGPWYPMPGIPGSSGMISPVR
jgi:membrane-associated protease RseP (regulator of RpoE activity)